MAKANKMISGLSKVGLWFVAARLLQLASGVYITRVLSAKEFTIIAIIYAVQGLVVKLTALNLASELVRSKTIESADIYVAWTYELVKNAFLWLLLFCAAPFIAQLMSEPNLAGDMQIATFGILISSFRNPRLIELRRDGKFGRLGMVDSLPMVVYGIAAAFYITLHPSYQSLIYAGLTAAVFGVLISYCFVPAIPRLNFSRERLKPLLSFGLVLLIGTFTLAMREHGIVFVVSGLGYVDSLGFLNRAMAFSTALSIQAIGIFWKVAYPHYSALRRDGTFEVSQVMLTSNCLAGIGLVCAGVAAFFSEDLIGFFLGQRWVVIADLWSFLLIAGAIFLSNAPFDAALLAMRKEKAQCLISLGSMLVFLITTALLLSRMGITAVGVAALVSGLSSAIALRVVAKNAMLDPTSEPL
ncbi:oligosaccharide flippase family protein [bacterium]|nr:oligosaccharide flippase family protein [bacterium]